MTDKGHNENDDNLRRKFQEFFDLRYVLQDGEWRLIKAIAIGGATLIIAGVATYGLHLILQ